MDSWEKDLLNAADYFTARLLSRNQKSAQYYWESSRDAKILVISSIDRNIQKLRGHRTAIFFEDTQLSYNQVHKMVNKTANALRDLGVQIEDRVLLVLLDTPEFYACFWGAIRIGAVCAGWHY